MKNSVQKTRAVILVLITIMLVMYLQSGCGNNHDNYDNQNNAVLSVTPDEAETENEPASIESQTDDIAQAIQQSTQDNLDMDSATRAEDESLYGALPQKSIALADANFIVTDNRSDNELIGYDNSQTFLQDFGFDDDQPFFQYIDEESGTLKLTLYYDEQTDLGGGICYNTDQKAARHAESDAKGFVFNSAGKLQYTDAFLSSLAESSNRLENIDCYAIHKNGLSTPDYYLYIDHTADCLRVAFLSRHDVIADAQGKRYGIVGPSLSRNEFAQAALSKANYQDTQLTTYTYAADYDGDGKEEAFVIAGEWGNSFGDSTLQYILGELWFVDSSCHATRLDSTRTFRAWQQYIRQDGVIYIFLDHETSFSSWGTLVFSVEESQPVIFWDTNETSAYLPEEDQPISFPRTSCTKHINDDGQIIFILSAYDDTLDIGLGDGHYLWQGHTWKPYTFEFDHGHWKETPAREVTRKEVESIAALPESFDESAYDAVQYILRENGELNINMAEVDQEYQLIHFSNITFLPGDTQEWIAQERDNNGIYYIQLNGDSHWDYLDNLLAELQSQR